MSNNKSYDKIWFITTHLGDGGFTLTHKQTVYFLQRMLCNVNRQFF